MKKYFKIIKIICACIIGFVILIHAVARIVMIVDTNALMDEAKNIFLGKVEENVLEGNVLKRYYHSWMKEVDDTKIKFDLKRVFVWHDFHKGYMLVEYTINADAPEGIYPPGYGAIGVRSLWEIEKKSGNWCVVKIYQSP